MLGKQDDNEALFQCVSMDSLVPEDHILRRLRAVVDLAFVRERVSELYSSVGRPSVDPEVVVRMWVLQHFYNCSERQLCQEMLMHAGYRWFCGLTFNDPVPDQSTLVKLRTEKWAETQIWEDVLDATVRACEEAGLLPSGRMGCDGTAVLANASIRSLEPMPPDLVLEVGNLPENNASDVSALGETGALDLPPVLRVERCSSRPRSSPVRGKTHRSRTDPDARWYTKNRFERPELRYLCHYMADLHTGIVHGAMATIATGFAEREAALTLLNRLKRKPAELVMDKAYRDSTFLASVASFGVDPCVDLADEPLIYATERTNKFRDGLCLMELAQQRRDIRARNDARERAGTARGRRALRQRRRMERLFAEAKQRHGLTKARARGVTRMDQQVKLTAAAQNLRRLANSGKRRSAGAMALRQAANHSELAQAAYTSSNAKSRSTNRPHPQPL